MLELYRALLRLRFETRLKRCDRLEAVPLDDTSIVVVRRGEHDTWLLVLNTAGERRLDLTRWRMAAPSGRWHVVLSTQEPRFRESAIPGEHAAVRIDPEGGLDLQLTGSEAAILRSV
jgi:hypothetical protein